MGKSAELPIALLGIWRRGAVHVPLFTAFAPPAIAFRLDASAAKVVVTDASQLPKLVPGEDIPADPAWSVIAVGGESGHPQFVDLIAAAEPTVSRLRWAPTG